MGGARGSPISDIALKDDLILPLFLPKIPKVRIVVFDLLQNAG